MKSSQNRSPEEALRLSTEALGGLQVVGSAFRTDIDPVLAGQWLAHCLTATKRDKLALTQIVKIFRDARGLGDHQGFQLFASICGYHAAPVGIDAELADALRQARTKQAEAEASAQTLQQIIDNPRLLALMQAAHVNTEGMTA